MTSVPECARSVPGTDRPDRAQVCLSVPPL
jgi:hypothetical protein